MKESPFVSAKFVKTFLGTNIIYKELDIDAFLTFSISTSRRSAKYPDNEYPVIKIFRSAPWIRLSTVFFVDFAFTAKDGGTVTTNDASMLEFNPYAVDTIL